MCCWSPDTRLPRGFEGNGWVCVCVKQGDAQMIDACVMFGCGCMCVFQVPMHAGGGGGERRGRGNGTMQAARQGRHPPPAHTTNTNTATWISNPTDTHTRARTCVVPLAVCFPQRLRFLSFSVFVRSHRLAAVAPAHSTSSLAAFALLPPPPK